MKVHLSHCELGCNGGVISLLSVGDKEADLEAGLRQLQHYYLDLEKFLNWLTEAETTANVLQDATFKEGLLENPATVRHLLEQWQVCEQYSSSKNNQVHSNPHL